MPVPNTLSDLSPVAASNSPQGTESAKGTIDDYLRAAFAFIAQLANLAGGPTTTLASSASVAIGFANTANIAISGSATITSFDSVAEGSLRYVTFSGAATLTHNAASLILPGAANIVTASGDSALFKSLGAGNWKCLSYQRASGVNVAQATASRDGYLAAADWSYFAAKQPALGFTPYDAANPAGYLPAATAATVYLAKAGGTMTDNLIFPNSKGVLATDTLGAVRALLYLDGANKVNLINAGGVSINFCNSAGASVASCSEQGDFTIRSWTTTSDETLKTNRRPLDEAVLDQVANLVDAGYFDWIDGTGTALGLSAQELLKIGLGVVVRENDKGKLSVDYAGLTAVLVHAMLRREKRRHAAIVARLDALEAA